jgi:hypothetical protein
MGGEDERDRGVLEEAKAAAGDKNVSVMGGVNIGERYIRA